MNFIYDSNEIEYRKLEARLRAPRRLPVWRSLLRMGIVIALGVMGR